MKKQRNALHMGVALVLIPLAVIGTQLPWVMNVYHGPRPISVAEFQQYGGGEPTDDYVAFEVSQSISTEVAVRYKGGKTTSRYLLVRVGDQWLLANVPADYKGGTINGCVRRLDSRWSGRDREALGRIRQLPNQPLLPYVIKADSNQKQGVWAMFEVLGGFILVGVFLCWSSLRQLSKAARGR